MRQTGGCISHQGRGAPCAAIDRSYMGRTPHLQLLKTACTHYLVCFRHLSGTDPRYGYHRLLLGTDALRRNRTVTSRGFFFCGTRTQIKRRSIQARRVHRGTLTTSRRHRPPAALIRLALAEAGIVGGRAAAGFAPRSFVPAAHCAGTVDGKPAFQRRRGGSGGVMARPNTSGRAVDGPLRATLWRF